MRLCQPFASTILDVDDCCHRLPRSLSRDAFRFANSFLSLMLLLASLLSHMHIYIPLPLPFSRDTADVVELNLRAPHQVLRIRRIIVPRADALHSDDRGRRPQRVRLRALALIGVRKGTVAAAGRAFRTQKLAEQAKRARKQPLAPSDPPQAAPAAPPRQILG